MDKTASYFLRKANLILTIFVFLFFLHYNSDSFISFMSKYSCLITFACYALAWWFLPGFWLKYSKKYYECSSKKRGNNLPDDLINDPLLLEAVNSANPVTYEDKKSAYKYPESNYAAALVTNPNYRIEKSDLKFILQSSLNLFVRALLGRKDILRIEPSAVEFLRKYRSKPLTCDFTSSPMYKIEPIDKEIARLCPYTCFALGVVLNVGYNVEPKDISIAKQNPESYFAIALEHRLNLKEKVNVS